MVVRACNELDVEILAAASIDIEILLDINVPLLVVDSHVVEFTRIGLEIARILVGLVQLVSGIELAEVDGIRDGSVSIDPSAQLDLVQAKHSIVTVHLADLEDGHAVDVSVTVNLAIWAIVVFIVVGLLVHVSHGGIHDLIRLNISLRGPGNSVVVELGPAHSRLDTDAVGT
jgi:hypothetical protein